MDVRQREGEGGVGGGTRVLIQGSVVGGGGRRDQGKGGYKVGEPGARNLHKV